MDDLDVETGGDEPGTDLHETARIPGGHETGAWGRRRDAGDLRIEHCPRHGGMEHGVDARHFHSTYRTPATGEA